MPNSFQYDAGNYSFAHVNGEYRMIAKSAELVVNDNSDDYDFRVESNGQEHMFYVNAGVDRVGFGTATPDSTVHVHGATAGSVDAAANTVVTLENSTDAYLSVLTPANATGGLVVGDPQDNDVARILYNHDDDDWGVWVAGAEKMTLDVTGLGLGVTEPYTELHVRKNVSGMASASGNAVVTIENNANADINILVPNTAAGGLAVGDPQDADAGLIFYDNSANYWAFNTNGTEKVRIDTNGKVGFGTSVPDTELHVHKATAGSASASGNAVLTIENNGNADINILVPSTNAGGLAVGDPDDADAGLLFYDNSANYWAFYTAASERMRVNATGLGLGTTNPSRIIEVPALWPTAPLADLWDQRSLSKYKEDIRPADDYLANLVSYRPRKWKRIPFVSADEIREAAIEAFDEDVWNLAFPNGDRAGAIGRLEPGPLRDFVDEFADSKRAERRPLPMWQKEHVGLVADDPGVPLKALSFNRDGVSLGDYIGVLHGALAELYDRVVALEAA